MIIMKKKCSNSPKGPENGYPEKKAESVGQGKKTSTKTKGFKQSFKPTHTKQVKSQDIK